MIVIDAHLDLSWNALNWNRDLTLNVPAIRRLESGLNEGNRGGNTVAFPEMRKGEVAICVATLLARASSLHEPNLDYRTPEMASAMAHGQVAYYRIMEAKGCLRMLTDWPSLESHFQNWDAANGTSPSLGVILSMEGADPILSPDQIAAWWNEGLRLLGPVHYGQNAYAHGTGSAGGLSPQGVALLKAMDEVGMILDVTHLADESFWQAVDVFQGSVVASHHNCRALVPGERQLTDDQIRYLIGRDSVIGSALDAWMLFPEYLPGHTPNSVVTLETVVDHIDHVCQLAGNACHAAIGSDLDGGFGREQSPCDLETIADLQKLVILLSRRGYQKEDIEAVMHGNWLRLFRKAWAQKESSSDVARAKQSLPLRPNHT